MNPSSLLAIISVLINTATFGLVNAKCTNNKCGDGCFEVYFNEQFENCNCCQNNNTLRNPCELVKCAAPCVVRAGPITPGDCSEIPLIAECRAECPLRKCAPYCVPTVNTQNCPSCYCNRTYENPCDKKDACPSGQECYLKEVICVTAPCYPVPKCRPYCPVLNICPEGCVKYEDNDGCLRCQCCNDCVNKKCPTGKKCVIMQHECFACPCFPEAECVDIK